MVVPCEVPVEEDVPSEVLVDIEDDVPVELDSLVLDPSEIL